MPKHSISNNVSKEIQLTKESPLEESQEEQARKQKQIQPLLNKSGATHELEALSFGYSANTTTPDSEGLSK